ncbi:MAG: prolipoprotein diacylglyceryl transferase [Lachnospiraceae bacterium]|nr:prolipoprotein diacylglyceryl transferase [Lachnospiraceae bacterium]MDD7379116.1 prolipoprotein diacylglyceryl transferase [Lachnospiraceae bacterium]MDY4617170.1 prolipoprotein diacylglyceryl transferase [Lachnospiraceae bacterium]MDY5775520.1 prolipoprotein diacylglyceryl transferase [Lachnospiraceae bacterium]
MNMNINFPHLNIYLEHVGNSFTIFGISIAYYGVIIAIGMLAGILMATYEAKRTGQNPEDYFDLAIVAIIFSIIGARAYYVIFSWDKYKDNLLNIFRLRQGGLAIYGGVIAAIITTLVFAKIKNLSFPKLADTAGLGLILGQIIGRWGNFFNREAFGGYTDGLLAMQIPVDAVRDSSDITAEMLEHIVEVGEISYIQVHPTFLYESLWNLAVLGILLIVRHHKKFEGEVFLLYLIGYGIGRFWIEALRTDQLLIPSTTIAVSQVLAAVLVVVSAVILLVSRRKH